MRHPVVPAPARMLVPLLLLALEGCAGGRPIPPETFVWLGTPVSFAPPPAAWRRQPFTGNGFTGVRFIRAGAVGESLEVAERTEPEGSGTSSPGGAPERGRDDGWTVRSEGDTSVAGIAARLVDYAPPPGADGQRMREFTFASGGHAFRARFRGLASSLRVFDRVVASISFPDSGAPAVSPGTP